MASRRRTGAYDAADLQVLEGLAPVRVRPGMYIGSTDEAGLRHLVFEVVGNSLDEHLAGFARQIEVELAEGWVSISDDGRGIPVAPQGSPGVPLVELVMTRLHVGATFDGHVPHVHIADRLHGVGLAVVNALSERLEVETRHDGSAWAMAFSRGKVVEPLSRIGDTTEHGTTVRFRPDPQIFGAASVDQEAVRGRLDELAWLSPKLRWRFQGNDCSRPDGLEGLLVARAPATLLPGSVVSFGGTVGDVQVELALALSSGKAKRLGFVNFAPSNAGSHLRGARDGITKAFGASAPALHKKLAAVIHVGLQHPRFEGPTRATLHLDEAQAAVSRVVSELLSQPSDLRIAWLDAARS